MSDLYREILIQRKTPLVNKLLKGLLFGITAICIAAGLLFLPLLLPVGLLLGIVFWFLVIPKLEVEYEYLYVNGSLDIDAIYSRQKRKRVAEYEMSELELLAPTGSHALDSYVNQKSKYRDFSSGDPEAKTYTLVYNKDRERELVKVELDDVVLGDIRRLAPRKVNLL